MDFMKIQYLRIAYNAPINTQNVLIPQLDKNAKDCIGKNSQTTAFARYDIMNQVRLLIAKDAITDMLLVQGKIPGPNVKG